MGGIGKQMNLRTIHYDHAGINPVTYRLHGGGVEFLSSVYQILPTLLYQYQPTNHLNAVFFSTCFLDLE